MKSLPNNHIEVKGIPISKVAKMRDSIMEDQDDLIVRKPECDEVGSEVNTNAALEDAGHNADLYIAIQEDNMQN